MTSTHWRPARSVKVKALGLHWRGGRLLAAEVHDDLGRLIGVRPLGGSIEFGEPWQAALKREFQEELGVEVEVLGPPMVLENIYTHQGETGHEVLFIAEVRFRVDETTNSIQFHESDGAACTARWFELDQLDQPGGPALFPAGLKIALQKMR